MSILAHQELINRIDEIFQSGSYAPENIRPYSYELRLANDDCLVKGEYFEPGKDCNVLIEIPPGQLAFLSTKEIFALAPDILGRFGLKFRFVRLGLVPLLTTFVEPGSQGRLYFPVLNASADTIVIRPGDEIITIIFHKVPAPKKGAELTPPHWDKLPTDIIDEHRRIHMMSAKELESRIKQLSNSLDDVRGGQEKVIALAVTVITATILGAVLQTMFGLFAITQGITSAAGNPWTLIWILLPSGLYCGSVIFVALLVVIVLGIRNKKTGLP